MKVVQSCQTLFDPMEFSRPEYWSGYYPFPSPGGLPNSGLKPISPTLQADSLPAEPQGKPRNTGMSSLIPSPGDLPDPGIKPGSPALQVNSLPTELTWLELKPSQNPWYLVSGPNEVRVLDVSSQKEFGERQNDR